MSKKSRARTNARQSEKQTASDLELKKAHIRDASSEQVAYLLLWGALTAVCLAVPVFFQSASVSLWFLPVAPAILTAIWAVRAIRFRRVARLYEGICHASEETVSFRCRKVDFYERQISKWKSILFCIAFYAEDGRVFYYVYAYREGLSPLAVKTIRKRFTGADVEFLCYRGTTAIKKFDPYQLILT